MSATPSYIATPRTPAAAFANADATSFKSIFTAGASGSRVDSLLVSNTDTSNAYVLQLALQKSGVDYVIGEVTIPIGSGTNGSAKSVFAMSPTDIPGLSNSEGGAIFMETGVVLRGRVKTTVAGVNSVQIAGIAGDY